MAAAKPGRQRRQRAGERGRTGVGITSRTPPEGRFEATVPNGLTRLPERANPPQIRFIYGGYPTRPYASQVFPSFLRDVAAVGVVKRECGRLQDRVQLERSR